MLDVKNQVLPTLKSPGFNGRSRTVLRQIAELEGKLAVVDEEGRIDFLQTQAFAIKQAMTMRERLEIRQTGEPLDEYCLVMAYAAQTIQFQAGYTALKYSSTNLSLTPIEIREFVS